MLYLKCDECGEVFEANESGSEAANRHARAEDHEGGPLTDPTYKLVTEDEAYGDETDGPSNPDYRLGTCGCTDYHMSDCPTRTSSLTPLDPDDDFYDRDY